MQLPTRFGCFISPLHPPGTDPYQLLQDDLRLAERLDVLGFDELWVGEHHTGGWATLSTPELFIAAAAQRTSRLKFATGVLSLPYHHPFLAAERVAMLDHLTSGRFVLGAGSGAYVSDMHVLGIDPSTSRTRLAESLECVQQLLAGETVTTRTDWFEVNEGRIQLRPFREAIEIVVASAATPFSMELAGRLGINAMSHVAPPWGALRAGQSLGIERLPGQWTHLENAAAHPVDRQDWRLVVPVHVSSSLEQARTELLPGWMFQRTELYGRTLGVPFPSAAMAHEKALSYTIEQGGIIAGSPEDCVRAVTELAERVGGFGSLLISLQDWAEAPVRARSLDLFAREVAPVLRGALSGVSASRAWVGEKSGEWAAVTARDRATAMSAAAPRG